MISKAVIYQALAKVFAEKAAAARQELEVGVHSVEAQVVVSLTGQVEVKEDLEYTPTTSIPHKATMALFMRYAGITGPAALKALVRALTESMEIAQLGKKAKEDRLAAIRELADLETAEAAVREGLAALPKATRNGAVTATVEVGTVRVSPL
ncbi:MAG: hypothetical protein IID17_06315 [Nitrospinae bacterium]|nr:hypothetical protein [Nitrospinota bacterium]